MCTTSVKWWKGTLHLEMPGFEMNTSQGGAGGGCNLLHLNSLKGLSYCQQGWNSHSELFYFLKISFLWSDHHAGRQTGMVRNGTLSFEVKSFLHCKVGKVMAERTSFAWHLQICSLQNYRMYLLVSHLEMGEQCRSNWHDHYWMLIWQQCILPLWDLFF